MNRADIDQFKGGIDPLAIHREAGRAARAVSPSFKDAPESARISSGCLRRSAGTPSSVELRHSSWSDRVADTVELLNGFGAAWTQIDEPKFRSSIRQNQLPNVRTFYYMRLHGRNAAQWWKHDETEDRYNYLYSAEELQPIAETATAARAIVKKAYLYMNNHFAAKSVANAVMIKHLVGEPVEGEYPQALVDRYDVLAPMVKTTETWATCRGGVARRCSASLLDEPRRWIRKGDGAARAGRRRELLRGPFDVRPFDHVADLDFRRHVGTADHVAEDRVLAVERGFGAKRDVELRVGLGRAAACAIATAPSCGGASSELGDSDRVCRFRPPAPRPR